MNRSFFKTLLMGGALTVSFLLFAQDKHNPTPSPLPSQMQTHLRVDVKDNTNELMIIQDNNDPDVITKAYVLKNADPYELRPYFRIAVRGERIKGDRTKVECIKYNDGTGILIVSAEAYRFGKQEHGIGFDELVQMLDIPNITSSSGSQSLVYFPKYHDARWLGDRIRLVGMNVANDDRELTGGADRIVVDPGLNGLLFYVPRYSVKNISEMLKTFDTPTPEVRVKYTVYELNSEDDGTLGVDFQAWKNGPGHDIFSTAYRFTDGWDVMKNIANNGPETRTQFFKFSPRWNTKFLDFLSVKGKASVITSGELSILNNREGRIESTTRIAGFRDGAKFANIETFGFFQLVDARIYNAYAGPPQDAMNDSRMAGRFRLSAWDDKGNLISISTRNSAAVPDPIVNDNDVYRGDLTITRVFDGQRYYYGLILDEEEAKFQGVQLVMQRRDSSSANTGNVQNFTGLGYRVEGLKDVRLERTEVVQAELDRVVAGDRYFYRYAWVRVPITFNTSESDTIFRDVARNTVVDGYGFVLSMIPSVCDEATIIDLQMSNTSLIGFNDIGSPRTARSEIQNKFMISNKGGRLVVGGVEKHAVVESVAKVPYLGDLPILGWLLSSESQVTKKSQVVAVLDCESVMPDTAVPASAESEISELKAKLEKAGDSNTYGFDQLLLDSEKKGLDPLP